MKEILSARGIQYFQFLQPNQYYRTDRTFSEDEREIAFTEASVFKGPGDDGLSKNVGEDQRLGEFGRQCV